MDQPKRLYRSRNEKMIAGIAGGLGEYFNIDPTLVRLLFVLFTFTGGPGLVAYIIMLIIVPEEPLASNDIVEPVEPDESVSDIDEA